MGRPVRKAIVLAAGYGTRFLPFTKVSPKEMLPVVDKPVIQYVVEEAVAAGVKEIFFVTSSNKRALEDHFDYNFELEEKLKDAGKQEEYDKIRQISDQAQFVYLRQKEPKGTGHAVLRSRDLVGNEPFMVLWGDEFIAAKPGWLCQLMATYQKVNQPVLTALENPDPVNGPDRYGFLETKKEGNQLRVTGLVEKPGEDSLPSNLISVSGFILNPDIFPIIENLEPVNGELILAKAIDQLARKRPLFACRLRQASYFDLGSKAGFIQANIAFGLQHPETRPALLEYLSKLRHAKDS